MKRRRRKKPFNNGLKKNGSTHLMSTKLPLPQAPGFQWNNTRILFCHYYVEQGGNNATRAAVRAGYKKTSADSHVHTLLNYKPIKQYIDALNQDRLKRLEISGDRLLKELACIAYSNKKDYYVINDDGTKRFKYIEEMTHEEAACIEKYNEVPVYGKGNETGIPKEIKVDIKFYPKMEAIKMLGNNLGLSLEKTVTENTNYNHSNDGSQYIKEKEMFKHLEIDELEQLHNLYAKVQQRKKEQLERSGSVGGPDGGDEPKTLH